MAESEKALHDGRFGEKFDDEVSVSSVVWSTIALSVTCILGMLITWGMWAYFDARAEAAQPPPSPLAEANERRMPSGPLLQNDPEGEMEALRHEMKQRLSTYGWVDETAGVAHIPIDVAMDLVVERAAAEPAVEETDDDTSEVAAE